MKFIKYWYAIREILDFRTVLVLLVLTLWPVAMVLGLPKLDFSRFDPNPFFVADDALGLVSAGLVWLLGLLLLEGVKKVRRITRDNPPLWWQVRLFLLAFFSGGCLGYRSGPGGFSRNWVYIMLFFGGIFLVLARRERQTSQHDLSNQTAQELSSHQDGSNPAGQNRFWAFWRNSTSVDTTFWLWIWASEGARMAANFQTVPLRVTESIFQVFLFIYLQYEWTQRVHRLPARMKMSRG